MEPSTLDPRQKDRLDKNLPLACSIGVIFRQERAHWFLNAPDIFVIYFNFKSEER